MSDYTPTTEDIRAGWEYATAVIGDEGTAQFDRWLAEVKAQVWDEAERRGRDNERALMMCQAQLRPSNSAVLIKNPYRQGEGSGNGASQSPVESSNLLNGEEQ